MATPLIRHRALRDYLAGVSVYLSKIKVGEGGYLNQREHIIHMVYFLCHPLTRSQ